MTPRYTLLAALALTWLAATSPGPARAEATVDVPHGPPHRNVTMIDGIADTSSFWIPDTTELARVNQRVLRAEEFIRTYYDAYAEDRPEGDSLGRVQWLTSMINKEVLGTVARRAGYAFGFEERVVMREHTQRVLSNVLFQRAVIDSVNVTEEDLHRRYDRLKTEAHLKRILLADRAVAEQVRRDLVERRITWEAAVAKYSAAKDDKPGGDLGWLGEALDSDQSEIFKLAPGQISPVLDDPYGFLIVQLVARRTVEPPAWEGIRSLIRKQVEKRQVQDRSDRLLAILRAQSGLAYDEENIRWSASRFNPRDPNASADMTIRVMMVLPVIAPADTSRILARWREGQISLGGFLKAYSDITPLQRPDVHTPDWFRRQVDAFVLEPYKANLAVQRGLDRDSIAVALIEKKREQLLVERLYRDSVEARVSVTPQQRRKYYNEHLAQFFTFPSVRYALFVRTDSTAAQALAARLRGGESALDLQRADSLAGLPATVRAEKQDGHSPFHLLLFNELKPGQVAAQGPDQKGQWAVIQSLAFDSGHQLPYEESERYADDHLRAVAEEAQFKKLIARHRKAFRITWRPELVRRIRLVEASMLQ